MDIDFMYCSNCGVPMPPEANFCAQCGKQVVVARDARVPSPAPAPVAVQPDPEPVLTSKTPPASPIASSAAIDPKGQGAKGASGPTDLDLERAASIGCVIYILFVMFGLWTIDLGIRVLVGLLYLGLAFGIWKRSRTAAIIGLVLACTNLVGAVVVVVREAANAPRGNPGSGVSLALFFCLLFFAWIKVLYSAVRSSFAYHRSRSATP